jgi:hypothetical protein
MMTTPDERRALMQVADLERPLKGVEDCLTALGLALHRSDAQAVERVAAELHAALAAAVDHFGRAARSGGVPPLLRQRLAQASGQVAAQREALSRATASLDRAIDVLMPRPQGGPVSLYSQAGSSDRLANSGGSLLA